MKILITYDFITTDEKLGISLIENLVFIKKILMVLNCEVTLINEIKEKFDKNAFFSSINREVHGNSLFQSFDSSLVAEKPLKQLKNFIQDYEFVIAYELSKETKELFNMMQIKFLDIWMAPYRFCEDIMFSFNSNVETVQKYLYENVMEEKVLQKRANGLSKYIELFEKSDIEVDNNSVLLVGQVLQDKSLLKDNKFLNLIDFKKRIKELSNIYTTIYLLKHPLMTKTEFIMYENEFKDISNLKYIENINIYILLAKKEIKKVVGISSSVLMEAKFFNKEVEYFYRPLFDEQFITIYKSFYQTDFWANVLGINKNLLGEYLNYDNLLRYNFDAFYSYGYFMKDKNIYDIRRKRETANNVLADIFYLLNNLDKEKEYVLYGYGTKSKLIFPFLMMNKIQVIGIIDRGLEEKQIKNVNGVKVMSFNELTKKHNIIFTASLYNDLIQNDLNQLGCNVIQLIK